jgi:hypothetical protein
VDQTIVKIEKDEKTGVTLHHFADGGKKAWAAIRAGLSWPTEEANGYFIILGEEYVGGTIYEGQEPPRGKILLLAEREVSSFFLDDTLRPLTDECALYGCRAVYADFDEETEANMENVTLAREYVSKQKSSISFQSAPFQGKFKVGLDILRPYLNEGILDLPASSMAQQQLDILSQADLVDKPEVKFVAVNGLRFVMGAFHKFRPNGLGVYHPPRGRQIKPRMVMGGSRF